MKKLCSLLIIFATLSSLSCKKKNKYILPEEDFVNIIVDIHLADAYYLNNEFRKLNLSELDSAVYYKHIFEKYQIEKARFDSTLKTYTLQPGLMELVYEKVIDKLQKMEAEINGLEGERINTKKNN